MARVKKVEYDLIGKIFKQLFRVRIPMSATMSDTWLRTNGGMYVSGTAYWDEKIKNQWQDGYITISKMVDYARSGVTISVVNPSDTKVIYDNIQLYLETALAKFQNFYDPGAYSDTLQDLIDLEKLANVVYHHARFYEDPGSDISSFASRFRSCIGGLDFISTNEDPIGKPPNSPMEKQRNSMQDMFMSMIDVDRIPTEKEKKDPFEEFDDI